MISFVSSILTLNEYIGKRHVVLVGRVGLLNRFNSAIADSYIIIDIADRLTVVFPEERVIGYNRPACAVLQLHSPALSHLRTRFRRKGHVQDAAICTQADIQPLGTSYNPRQSTVLFPVSRYRNTIAGIEHQIAAVNCCGFSIRINKDFANIVCIGIVSAHRHSRDSRIRIPHLKSEKCALKHVRIRGPYTCGNLTKCRRFQFQRFSDRFKDCAGLFQCFGHVLAGVVLVAQRLSHVAHRVDLLANLLSVLFRHVLGCRQLRHRVQERLNLCGYFLALRRFRRYRLFAHLRRFRHFGLFAHLRRFRHFGLFACLRRFRHFGLFACLRRFRLARLSLFALRLDCFSGFIVSGRLIILIRRAYFPAQIRDDFDAFNGPRRKCRYVHRSDA